MNTKNQLYTTLMVVEDSDEDFEALSRVLLKLGLDSRVQRCRDGQECLDELRRKNADISSDYMPLILLDLNLPGLDGREALREIKADPGLRDVPITVLTTSSNVRDVEECYAAGANAYVIKSLDFNEFANSIEALTEFWLGSVTFPPYMSMVKQ